MMDFSVGLPRNKEPHNAILVIIDRLRIYSHFPSIMTADPLDISTLYSRKLLTCIVSDRDCRLTSRF